MNSLTDLQKSLDKIEFTYFDQKDVATYSTMDGKTEQQFKQFKKLFSTFKERLSEFIRREECACHNSQFKRINDYNQGKKDILDKLKKELLEGSVKGDLKRNT